jgi:ABC-type multidrug transport system fused ATPase/permease subunit
MDFLQTFTSLLAQFGVFFLGAYLSITTDKMAPSVIILFVQLMNYVMSPLIQVPSIISTRNACLPLFDKMANMIQSEEESGKKEITFNECIKLQNVSFAYDEKQVLNNISYTFEKNKSYAIVGTSGSGKSTLINLLMGRYLNYEGHINYDKQELRELSIDSLYNISSSVEQNVFVFDDTIINNITMYSNFDEQIINQVLAESGLTELVNQKGEDYKCGENGTALSGGEKQRISIARALLKKSQIILMDEATSALDNETSSRIINNVLDIKNTTKIIITHRLDENTLSKYDQILVIKNGQLIENGTFNELINKNGLFKNLYDIN